MSLPAQMARDGFVRVAPLMNWENIDVLGVVRRALPVPVPVIVENDANAFAIGATYGRGELRPGVTLFIVLESGVGGGVVIDGTLFRGAHGLAGEIGHLPVPTADGREPALEELIGLERVLAAYGRARASSGRRSPTSSPTSTTASRAPWRSPRTGRGRWPMRWSRSAG